VAEFLRIPLRRESFTIAYGNDGIEETPLPLTAMLDERIPAPLVSQELTNGGSIMILCRERTFVARCTGSERRLVDRRSLGVKAVGELDR